MSNYHSNTTHFTNPKNDQIKLSNKTILIISPQSWGNMFLAKHHYAIELAKYGNEVYFLNPPIDKIKKRSINIEKVNNINNLFLINHSIGFNYKIKFRFKSLFHFLMKFHIKKIEKAIKSPIDIIWSFDLGDYYPFKYFAKKSLKIFNPIDEPLNKDGLYSANDCDIIFSVTKEILEKYYHLNVPKYFIHHGLSDEFVYENSTKSNDSKLRVGLSGNWLRKDIDFSTLLYIVQENPEIDFEFWGSYKITQSNIGGSENEEIKTFINTLISLKNVILHGPIPPIKLAKELQRMNAFLICYNIQKDQSKGTNYHKVMEYLSTGKVVISNNISTYKNLPELIVMTKSRMSNDQLPDVFEKVINNINSYNSETLQTLRKKFALSNLYTNKIKEIENYLSISFPSK